MTSFEGEGNTTAVQLLVGGASRHGKTSCAEHKCPVAGPKLDRRLYARGPRIRTVLPPPPSPCSWSLSWLCCVLNLLTLPHDGSLSHLDISDWLVCCLAMACARSSLCILCSSACGHSTSTGRWTLFRDLEDGAWSPADSHNMWLSQAIS